MISPGEPERYGHVPASGTSPITANWETDGAGVQVEWAHAAQFAALIAPYNCPMQEVYGGAGGEN
jgi:hypothetical protein